MSWITWCRCKRIILTTKQIKENKDCILCQKDHAEKYHQRFDIKEGMDSVKTQIQEWRS